MYAYPSTYSYVHGHKHTDVYTHTTPCSYADHNLYPPSTTRFSLFVRFTHLMRLCVCTPSMQGLISHTAPDTRCTVDGQLRTRLCSTTILLNRYTCALSEMLLKKYHTCTNKCSKHSITTGAGACSAVEPPAMRAIQNAPFRAAAHLPGGQVVLAPTIGIRRIRTPRKQAISNANRSRKDSSQIGHQR